VWVVAILFAALHVVLVAAPLFHSGGSGESQAFAVLAFDYPLFWLLDQFEWGRDILSSNFGATSRRMYMLIFGIGGTIFWTALGAALAYVVVRLVRRGPAAESGR
jgi:hypothetical protein